MTKSLSIAELCRCTGLTSRTLRFYDARGLVAAGRTAAGQRCYGPAEIARLHQVTALKRAGFSLAQIGAILGGQKFDLARLIEAQLATLDVERDRIDEATASLRAARDRLAAGRAIDVETFCALIKQGEQTMTTQKAWKKVLDRYYTPEEQAHWRAAKDRLDADFDHEGYNARWIELNDRIEAALPLDPASPEAQAFVDEWNALVAPFMAVADEAMKSGTQTLWDNMADWQGDVRTPISSKVWAFIKAAMTARDPSLASA